MSFGIVLAGWLTGGAGALNATYSDTETEKKVSGFKVEHCPLDGSFGCGADGE